MDSRQLFIRCSWCLSNPAISDYKEKREKRRDTDVSGDFGRMRDNDFYERITT